MRLAIVSVLLTVLTTTAVDAQPIYYRVGPVVRYVPMAVPRPLPRPRMGPVYYPPGAQALFVRYVLYLSERGLRD